MGGGYITVGRRGAPLAPLRKLRSNLIASPTRRRAYCMMARAMRCTESR